MCSTHQIYEMSDLVFVIVASTSTLSLTMLFFVLLLLFEGIGRAFNTLQHLNYQMYDVCAVTIIRFCMKLFFCFFAPSISLIWLILFSVFFTPMFHSLFCLFHCFVSVSSLSTSLLDFVCFFLFHIYDVM